MSWLLYLVLFFVMQSAVLLCCLAAGNDAASQMISDMEQIEYIQGWLKKHRI